MRDNIISPQNLVKVFLEDSGFSLPGMTQPPLKGYK